MAFINNLKKGAYNNRIIIFLVMFSTGLASLLYEVVLISVVNTIVGATEISLSIVLASFLFGLAVGALIGGFVVKKKLPLIRLLMGIELLIALFGFTFLSFISQFVSSGIPTHIIFWIIIVSLLIPTLLMGMEIPIAVAILENIEKTKATGFVYFSDTLGGVIGALFTGIFFIPLLGFHGAMYFGAILNVFTFVLAARISEKRILSFFVAVIVIFGVIIGILFSATGFLQLLKLRFVDSFYGIGSAYYSVYFTKPIFSIQSPYQHIIILETPFYGRQLMLDGQPQISDKASIQYHEYLTMPAIATHPNPEKVLLIGGGDGGALYQLLKFNFSVIDHVDLDVKVIEVSKEYLEDIHRGSLDDNRVNRHIQDGRQFLKQVNDEYYDIVIIDLPDPNKLSLAPLYSEEFYEEVRRVLKDKGIMVTQFTPPYYFLEGFDSAYKTIKLVFPETYPYVIPGSLQGSLGYIIAGKNIDPRIVRNRNVEGVWYETAQNMYLFNLPKFIKNYLENNSIQVSTDDNPIIHVYMQNNYFYKGVADNPDLGR